jgi:Mor family transcriptional regulator
VNTQQDFRTEDFPESLAEAVKDIGIPATLKLIKRFGGVRLYVPEPQHITENHVIARTIGLASARAIAKIWPNERPEIPSAARAFRRARDRAILREATSLSKSKLALKYNLSERQLYNILSRPVSAFRRSDDTRVRATRRGRFI